jgi:hypothetical protein
MDKIILSDHIIGRCYRFSYQVTEQTDEYYKSRNNYASTEKLISDHFIAKLAEVYVYHYLTNKDYVCSFPGFEIKQGQDRKKYSNDADLIVFKNDKRINVHIKCVRHDCPVKDSWLVQANNKCVMDPNENDYFALCVFHSPEDIRIKKFVQARRIKWQATKKNLKSKRACYLNDLEISV